MKHSNEILEINTELDTTINTLNELIKIYKKKIKKECQQIIIDEKYKLLLKVSNIYKIDYDDLKNKCLKSKEILNAPNISKTYSNDVILDKTELNGIIYYYENKENGKVYDNDYNEVGEYINNNIIIF